MPNVLRSLFDAIISALGGGADDKPRPAPPPKTKATNLPPLIPPRADGTPNIVAMNGLRITAADCRVCGHALKPGDEQFCSWECEQRLSDSMDAWHDQFEARFGDD